MSVLALWGDVFISLYPYLSIRLSVIFSKVQKRAMPIVRAGSVASVLSDSVTPWTAPCQAPLSLGLSRQEYWNGVLSPRPEELPNSVIEPASLVPPSLQSDSLPLLHQGNPAHSGSSVNIFGLISSLKSILETWFLVLTWYLVFWLLLKISCENKNEIVSFKIVLLNRKLSFLTLFKIEV